MGHSLQGVEAAGLQLDEPVLPVLPRNAKIVDGAGENTEGLPVQKKGAAFSCQFAHRFHLVKWISGFRWEDGRNPQPCQPGSGIQSSRGGRALLPGICRRCRPLANFTGTVYHECF